MTPFLTRLPPSVFSAAFAGSAVSTVKELVVGLGAVFSSDLQAAKHAQAKAPTVALRNSFLSMI